MNMRLHAQFSVEEGEMVGGASTEDPVQNAQTPSFPR
jgi:hypothetical protein